MANPLEMELQFDRDKALQFAEAIKSGKPIGPVSESERLALAGACMYVEYQRQLEREDVKNLDDLEPLARLLGYGIRACANFINKSVEGSYDDVFKPKIRATIGREGAMEFTSYPMTWEHGKFG